MIETDEKFIDRMEHDWVHDIIPNSDDADRLFDLARRGAEMQWRPIQEDYEGEVILWPRGSAVPSHFLPIPPPPAGETNER